MESPETEPFVVKLERGLNMNSDLLLRPIVNLDPVLGNRFQSGCSYWKWCSQKYRWNAPRKNGSCCLWAWACV